MTPQYPPLRGKLTPRGEAFHAGGVEGCHVADAPVRAPSGGAEYPAPLAGRGKSCSCRSSAAPEAGGARGRVGGGGEAPSPRTACRWQPELNLEAAAAGEAGPGGAAPRSRAPRHDTARPPRRTPAAGHGHPCAPPGQRDPPSLRAAGGEVPAAGLRLPSVCPSAVLSPPPHRAVPQNVTRGSLRVPNLSSLPGG